MFSIIGVVMLMGLVTKNAILLVDFAIRAREEHVNDQGQTVPGLPRADALLLAARVRLRPILMTTARAEAWLCAWKGREGWGGQRRGAGKPAAPGRIKDTTQSNQ